MIKSLRKWGDNTKTYIDYDILFEDLDEDELVLLKNAKQLTKYIDLRKKGLKKNDALWGIYNDLKLNYEFKNELYALSNILHRMARLLSSENRKRDSIECLYSSYYCIALAKINNIRNFDFGTTRKRELLNTLNNRKFSLKEFEASILSLIPSKYNEKNVNVIFDLINNYINQ